MKVVFGAAALRVSGAVVNVVCTPFAVRLIGDVVKTVCGVRVGRGCGAGVIMPGRAEAAGAATLAGIAPGPSAAVLAANAAAAT